jgi:hypothetical protein
MTRKMLGILILVAVLGLVTCQSVFRSAFGAQPVPQTVVHHAAA